MPQTAKPILPKELFGQKPNVNLLAQAYYIAESRAHKGSHKTKTRGEVTGTTAKVYRQKGTGRARHGAKTAPIYVGGGIVFGPTGEKRVLGLGKRQGRKALIMALSARSKENKVLVVDSKSFDGKTHTASKLFDRLAPIGKILLLHGGEKEVTQSSRNIARVTSNLASQANTYNIIRNSNLVITKMGLGILTETFGKKVALIRQAQGKTK